MKLDCLINIAVIIYIIFSLFIVLLLGYRLIKNTIDDKLLEFSKWYFASVVLVLIASLIESGFKERETGITEMEIYNTYVETVIKADNIEERWKLAQFFSNVTPTERLNKGWKNYLDTIRSEYQLYKYLKEKEFELIINPDTTEKYKTEVKTVQKQLKPFEKSLAPSSSKSSNWVAVFMSVSNLKRARNVLNQLVDDGLSSLKILEVIPNSSYYIISKRFKNRNEVAEYTKSFQETERKNPLYSMKVNASITNLDELCAGIDMKDNLLWICK